MNPSSTSHLLSPNSAAQAALDSSLVSSTPDIQDTKSSHSDQHQITSSPSATTGHQQHLEDNRRDNAAHHDSNQMRSSVKTEYKSNFTPFDQYVYNEITDSFVKQPHLRNTVSNNLLIESRTNPLSASSSNQDLAAHSEAHAQHSTSAVSPALEAAIFDPVNLSDTHQQHNVTSEPWYMEVMKRNEKAHEYRYKSELGHNSSLLHDVAAVEKDLVRKSPLGNDPLIEAQILDKQQQLNTTNKFSTHEYKRDHMISHMANNNNFKLPKVGSANGNGGGGPPTARRVVTTTTTSTSSRPLSRTTASSRARSQSSKRPVATTTASAKSDSTTKSNQTTPTKSVPSRVSTAARPKPPPVTRTTPGTLSNGTGRPATAATRRPTTAAASSTTSSRMATPKMSTNASTSTTNRTSSTASSSVTRSTGLKTSSPAATKTATRSLATSNTATQATKSPVKRATNITSTTSRPTTSRPTTTRYSGNTPSTRTTKQAASSTTATTSPIKSIKTRALVDAGEKTAALAANLASDADTSGNDQQHIVPETNTLTTSKQEDTVQQTDLDEATLFTPAAVENYGLLNPEPNLIFQTTEAGNMLADELAQAEKFASESILKEQQIEQVRKTSDATIPERLESVEAIGLDNAETKEMGESHDATPTPIPESSELVNGLEGGLVSTEDRYESSERNVSLDYGTQQSGQSCGQHDQSYDHEPYSIMPTIYGDDKKHEELVSEPVDHEINIAAAEEVDVEPKSSHSDVSENREIIDTLNKPTDTAAKVVEDSVSSSTGVDTDDKQPDVVDTTDVVAANYMDDAHQTTNDLQPSESNRSDELSSKESDAEQQRDLDMIGCDVVTTTEKLDLHKSSSSVSESEEAAVISDQVEMTKQAVDETTSNNDCEPVAADHDLSQTEATHDGPVISAGSPERVESIDTDHELDNAIPQTQQPDSTALDELKDDLRDDEDVAEKLEETKLDDDLIVSSTGMMPADKDDQMIFDHEARRESHEQVAQIHRQSIVDDDHDDMGSDNRSNDEIQDVEGSSIQQQTSVDNRSSTDQLDHAATGSHADKEPIEPSQTKTEDDDDSDDEINVNKNELLMNVSELETIESMKRQEMSRKSELAREQRNSTASLTAQHPSELLLSVDQLDEHFAQQVSTAEADCEPEQQESQQNKDIDLVDEPINTDDDNDADQHVKLDQVESNAHDIGLDGLGLPESSKEAVPEVSVKSEANPLGEPSPSADLLNFGSITPTNDQTNLDSDAAETPWNLGTLKEQKEDTGSKTYDTFEVNRESTSEATQSKSLRRDSSSDQEDNFDMYQAKHESDPVTNLETDSNQATKSTTSVNEDEIDEEEQLKLSNHLTNSDDDVILEPRNRKDESFSDDAFSPHRSVSPSRYNEGAGLGLMAQEDEEVGTVEFADGSSAEIVAPTVAENRVEVSTSKALMPEISQAAAFIHPPKFTQEDDYDEHEDWNLNPSADPIDVAATMSPSSSVAEEMLRLSQQASLTNAIAELNVSDGLPSPAVGGLDDANAKEEKEAAREGSGGGESTGVVTATGDDERVRRESVGDTNVMRSKSSSASSLSSREQRLNSSSSQPAIDTPEIKSDRSGDPELVPINNNDIDNVENRKQNIDINSDRNSGNVEQVEEKQQVQGAPVAAAGLADKADQMAFGGQAKDVDVTLATNWTNHSDI